MTNEDLIVVTPENDIETGKVTCLRSSNDDGEFLYIGTKKGFVTVFNHESKQIKTVKLEPKNSNEHKVK